MIYKSQNAEYEVLKKLGEGESGITYLVKSNNKEFVLKELKISTVENWKTIDRFKKEIKHLKSLNHKNIPKYIDFIENDNKISYIQEYIKGHSLEYIIENGISISIKNLESYIRQGLEILDYIQSLENPLIHRDISPKNIIIDNDNLYLIDLGVALTYDKNNSTVTTAGTFGYMPPEQIMGKPILKSDIYSLGMTFISLINQTTVENLPLLKNDKIDIEKSVLMLPEKLKKLLISMTQSGVSLRLKNPKRGIKYLDKKFDKLCYEKEISATKKHNTTKKIFLSLFLLIFLYASYNYHNLTKTTSSRVKVFGSLVNGHPYFLSVITKSLFGDYSLISNSSYINFLKTIKQDRYLITIADKVILWDFKTGDILWKTEIPYNAVGMNIYIDKNENNLFLNSKFQTIEINLKSGKLNKSSTHLNTNNLVALKTNTNNYKKYKYLFDKYKNIKKVIRNPYRNEILLIKKNFVYIYDELLDKKICKFEVLSRDNEKFAISSIKNGLFAVNPNTLVGKNSIKIYNNRCKLVKTINSDLSMPVMNFTQDGKYIIIGAIGGFIYVRKI